LTDTEEPAAEDAPLIEEPATTEGDEFVSGADFETEVTAPAPPAKPEFTAPSEPKRDASAEPLVKDTAPTPAVDASAPSGPPKQPTPAPEPVSQDEVLKDSVQVNFSSLTYVSVLWLAARGGRRGGGRGKQD